MVAERKWMSESKDHHTSDSELCSSVSKISWHSNMRRARLILPLFLVLFVPSGVPVVTRHAASLLRAEGIKCCPEDAQLLPFLREAGQNGRPSSLEAKNSDETLPKGFWGEKGAEEILVRRAGLASKRAKQPRKPAANKQVRLYPR
jgi:hypothetical protein